MTNRTELGLEMHPCLRALIRDRRDWESNTGLPPSTPRLLQLGEGGFLITTLIKGLALSFLPFPSYRRFLTPLQQTAIWKHSDKRRNCTKRAISPFATMFSTFCHRLSIQLWRCSMFWQNTFKVVCCRGVQKRLFEGKGERCWIPEK